MIDQFYGMDLGDKKIIIKEGETFSCGKTHTSLCDGANGALAGSYDDLR